MPKHTCRCKSVGKFVIWPKHTCRCKSMGNLVSTSIYVYLYMCR